MAAPPFDPALMSEIKRRLWAVSSRLNRKFIIVGRDGVRVRDHPRLEEHAVRAFQFLLTARVKKVVADAAPVDGPDGPGVKILHKVRLTGLVDGRKAVRTILLSGDLLGQLLRSEGFHPADATVVSLGDPAAGVKGLLDLVPNPVWDRLRAGLGKGMAALRDDSAAQAALAQKMEAARKAAFEKERQQLIHEMVRLQRRGWTAADVTSCWDEALVKGVMES